MSSSAMMEPHSNVGFQSEKTMEPLYISTALKITKGKGQLAFPEALKRDALHSSLQCISLSFEANSRAANETCFLIASGSQYCGEHLNRENNILAMFQNKRGAHVVPLPVLEIPITSPQQKIEIKIVDFEGDLCDTINCFAVFLVKGIIENRMLAI